MPVNIDCPTCKKTVEWNPTSRCKPFCCERCKLIDLGDWASETHKIPVSATSIEDEQALYELANNNEHLFK